MTRTQFLLFLFVFFNLSVFSQTKSWEHSRFDEVTVNHKVLAILPFEVTIMLPQHRMQKPGSKELAENEKREGYRYQKSMYAWFNIRLKDRKIDLDVLDTTQTNAMLRAAGYKNIDYQRVTPGKLAKALDADAVVVGRIALYSRVDSRLMTLFVPDPVEVDVGSVVFGSGNFSSPYTFYLDLRIFNADDGELLFRYERSVSGSSPQDMKDKLLRKASRKIPYMKK